MKAETFAIIENKLNKIINDTNSFLEGVKTTEDLRQMTYVKLDDLVTKARAMQARTDQFLKEELYHIIGMGNLTVVQTVKIAHLTKQITSQRSYTKNIAGIPLPKMPGIPSDARYQLKSFGVTLSTDFNK